jgi:hypothetical protein
MAGKNRQSAVYLLSQNDAGELMRQGHPPERPKQVRPFPRHWRPAIRRSDGEHEALNSLVAEPAEVRGEFLRGELLAAAIQQNGVRRSAAGVAI